LSSCAAETPLKNIKLLSNTKHRPTQRRAIASVSFGSVFLTVPSARESSRLRCANLSIIRADAPLINREDKLEFLSPTTSQYTRIGLLRNSARSMRNLETLAEPFSSRRFKDFFQSRVTVFEDSIQIPRDKKSIHQSAAEYRVLDVIAD
jgi:hypothetical protein